MSKILILGGYGYTGKLLAKYLLAQTDAQIVIAGRSLVKAQNFVAELADPRASALKVDASVAATLQPALQDVDLCLVAAPTTRHAETVIYACLAAGADYLDVQLSASKWKALQAAEPQIRKAGRCFVTEAGFHPGLPSVMIRYAAKKLDKIESAVTAGYLNMGHGLPYTEAVDELMELFLNYEAQVFKNGAWTKPSEWSMTKFDFGPEIGKRSCYSMFFEELRKLPRMYPTLKETGFYISGSNWLADLLITPIVMLGLKLAPKRGIRPLGKLMWWGMQQSKPPFVVMIAVEAKGLKNGSPSTIRAQVSHPDGYVLTAIPVVAYLKQYLDGSARRVGLHLMGHLAEPERLFKDMQAMGAKVNVEE
jgi:saccharopine dehydrogenase (NAD+, L-lysine-forming)